MALAIIVCNAFINAGQPEFTGFYSYHGMSFLQKMRLKLHFAFGNKALAYESTEGIRQGQTGQGEKSGEVKGNC